MKWGFDLLIDGIAGTDSDPNSSEPDAARTWRLRKIVGHAPQLWLAALDGTTVTGSLYVKDEDSGFWVKGSGDIVSIPAAAGVSTAPIIAPGALAFIRLTVVTVTTKVGVFYG